MDLDEGRNIIEVKAGDKAEYFVATARAVDVKLDNLYSPGNPLAVGDTVRVTLNNILPTLYKQGAIYNPSGNQLSFLANGTKITRDLGQYTISTNANFDIVLTEDDEGTFTLANGGISTSFWGASQGQHKQLTRSSTLSLWTGGDNPDIDLGKLISLPDISFEVISNEDYDEAQARKRGAMEAASISLTNQNDALVTLGSSWGTEEKPISRNVATLATPTAAKNPIKVGAAPLYDDEAKILVRYWIGNGPSQARVMEIPSSTVQLSKDQYGNTVARLPVTEVISGNTLTKDSGAANIEVVCVPTSGEPSTYAGYIYHMQAAQTVPPVLKELSIAAAPNSGSFGRFDGILEAKDAIYTDDEGQEQTLDLGYGFIITENSYTTQVPYETDSIVYKATVNGKSFYAKINGEDIQYSAGESIPLREGENTLVVTAVNARGLTNDYTITITRATAPKEITIKAPEGAQVVVKQNGKTIDPVADAETPNTCALNSGDYVCYVSQKGYYTAVEKFTVTGDGATTITIDKLKELPEQNGSFEISIDAQSAELQALTTRKIPETVEDLAAKKYVDYNYGGYTVLHALLDACGDSIGFKCSKGNLQIRADIDTDGLGSDAGWVCEVNGVTVDPATTLVKKDDVIRYYYNSDYAGMMHVWFRPEAATVKKGDSVTLHLYGSDVCNDDGSFEIVTGAVVYTVSGEYIGTTNRYGEVIIPADKLSALGAHRFTAVEKNDEGHNVLTYAVATVTVVKAEQVGADPSKTNVTFRLIGDTNHGKSAGENAQAHEYTTWIATTEYTFNDGDVSVGDVFRYALNQAKLEYDDTSDNYVAWIEAPKSLGGYQLKEKTNDPNSGWMFTVNGSHPKSGLNDVEVTNGDEIVWHYVDDYTIEVSDWAGGSSGNTSTWDKWLEAEDVNPSSNGDDPGGDDDDQLAVDAVEELIGAIGEVTLDSGAAIQKAREAYEKLSIIQKKKVENYGALTAAEKTYADLLAATEVDINEMYKKTGEYLLTLEPKSGSTNGEWLMLGLARSEKTRDGVKLPANKRNTYLNAVREALESIDSNGRLDDEKPTENSRVALALTSLGYDPADFDEIDLMKALENVDWVTGQGNNSTAFALIAMDACDYETKEPSVRDDLIKSLLEKQLPSGAWGINDNSADQDTTMMVVQALAPYYESESNVKTAVDKALAYVKAAQTADGGFGDSVEGNAQVIVALTALEINPAGEDWQKDGKSVLDALNDYFVGYGFKHEKDKGYNQMATEQAYYALVAYYRYQENLPSLYDMSDRPDLADTYSIKVTDLQHGSISAPEEAKEGDRVKVMVKANLGYEVAALYVNGDEITADEDGTFIFTMPAKTVILTATFKKSDSIQGELAEAMIELDVRDADEETYELIRQIQEAYDALTDEQQQELAEAYEAFQQQVEKFEELLNEYKEDAEEELEDYLDDLDKSDYSKDNWKKITRIYDDALDDIDDALFEEKIDDIVKDAIKQIKKVAIGGEMEVTFRLIGDFQHDNGVTDHDTYVTWIETTEYELEAGSTVYDLFMEAMDDFDLNQKGAKNNYVSSIQAPDEFGGYWLGEFDNGKNSGWMYTVNGKHPSYGLKDWELEDGDKVVWHYVDDYTLEERNTSSKYYERWLEAKDISPAKYASRLIEDIVTVGKNGSVTPKLDVDDLGDDVTFRFKPDNGYVIKDVIIDGKSQGAIESYTYKNLSAGSRIEVVFMAAEMADILTIGQYGSVSPEIDLDDIGRNVTFTFTPDMGYVIGDVIVDGKSMGAVTSYTYYNLSMDSRVEVKFVPMHQTVFYDVPSSAWYYDAVQYVVENGLFAGVSEYYFEPNTNFSRAMIVSVLYRMEGKPIVIGGNTFSDVKDNAWYTEAISWASGAGIVSGNGEGKFDPNGNLTREQMASILYRYSEMKGWNTSSAANLDAFADGAKTSSWAVRAMQWANAEGLVNGKDGNHLDPLGQASRAEAAAIVMRLLQTQGK